MTINEKILMLYEIQFVHDAVQALRLRTVTEIPGAIDFLEEKVDELWQRIEKQTKGAQQIYYKRQLKSQKLTVVPMNRPPNKEERQRAHFV